MRTIYWYLHFIITLLLTIPKFNKVYKQKNKMPKNTYEDEVNKIVRNWASSQIKASGIKVNITGEENIPDTNVVFISNHQGDFDVPLLIMYLKKNIGFLAKKELSNVPIIRKWMREIRCVFLDRKDVKQSLKAILESIEIIKDDYSLVIFPEGTRSKGPNINEFKEGSFKIATKTKVPIVPITINGSYKAFEKNHYFIKPTLVNITIHKPIETKDLSKEEISNLSENVKNIISSVIK